MGSWEPPDASLGGPAFCLDGSTPIIGGIDSILVLDTPGSVVTPLAGLDRNNNGLRLTGVSDGCKALVTKVNESNTEIMDSAIIDLRESTLGPGPVFYRDRYDSSLVLFENGTKMLQHIGIAEIDESGAFAGLITPTSQFRILDTEDGTVLSEADIDIDQGKIVGRMSWSCEAPGTKKILGKGKNDVIYMIDIQKLSVVASSIKIPFDGNYYIF